MNIAAVDGKKNFIKSHYYIKIDSEESVCGGGNLRSYSDSSWKLWFMLLLAFLLTVRGKSSFLYNISCYYENYFKIITSQSHLTILQSIMIF